MLRGVLVPRVAARLVVVARKYEGKIERRRGETIKPGRRWSRGRR
jgi:hypothetical protein